jgi:FlaG/FlaF family flagellin (archaellin)
MSGNIMILENRENAEMRFYTNGAERMQISNNGNLEFKSTTTTFTGASSFTNHSNGVLYLRGGTSGLRLDDDDSHNTIHVSGAGNYISFETLNGTERWRFNSSGHFTPAQQHTYDIGGTNAEVRNIYAQGISFASNAHAGGMTSELLDDYEEGTWTPTLNSGSFSASTATYTKVGRVVTVTLDATVGTGGGSNITLPYACTNTTGTGIYVSNQNFATGRTQMCWVAASTKIYFRSIGDNVIYSGEALTAGATIHATITYNAT